MSELSYEPEFPERGYRFLGGEVRRKGVTFPVEEVRAALDKYTKTAAESVRTGNWNTWADLFTEDAIYVEHQYGVLRGQDQIRNWICSVMQGHTLELEFPIEFSVIDNDLIVCYVPNTYRDPTDPAGESVQFGCITILIYAGDGRFCYEEDIYNAVESARIHQVYLGLKAHV